MANLSLEGGNKWDAASIYDTTQEAGQNTLNATTAAVAALVTAQNNDKFMTVQSGQLAMVSLETWTGGSY